MKVQHSKQRPARLERVATRSIWSPKLLLEEFFSEINTKVENGTYRHDDFLEAADDGSTVPSWDDHCYGWKISAKGDLRDREDESAWAVPTPDKDKVQE